MVIDRIEHAAQYERLGEGIEPGDETRMRCAPFAFMAQVEIAERAGKRDFADSRAVGKGRRRTVKNLGNPGFCALRPSVTVF